MHFWLWRKANSSTAAFVICTQYKNIIKIKVTNFIHVVDSSAKEIKSNALWEYKKKGT